MLAMINAVLDPSRIAGDHLSLACETVNLFEVIDRAVVVVSAAAAAEDVGLVVAPHSGVMRLRADPTRLRQILINLLHNAVKFTPPGGEVEVSATPDPTRSVVVVRVSDTGIGIPADQLSAIFEPFHQIDSALSRAHEGTGLGLALVKRLVDLHGGRISVASTEGRGTVFTVELPVEGPADLE